MAKLMLARFPQTGVALVQTLINSPRAQMIGPIKAMLNCPLPDVTVLECFANQGGGAFVGGNAQEIGVMFVNQITD